jgi:hypothetical protein
VREKLGAWNVFKYKQMTAKLDQKEHDFEIVTERDDLGLRHTEIEIVLPPAFFLTSIAFLLNSSKSFV